MTTSNPSPATLTRPDTVIRLTLYRAASRAELPAEEAARFIEAWRSLVASTPRDGVVYRELDRQVPAWSALAAAEIDNPIDAAFVEYLVVEPGTDLSRLPALPPGEEAHYTVTSDLHSVAFRLARTDVPGAPGALMFNLFEIDGPPALEQGFLMEWVARGQFKLGEPSTFSSLLHQRLLPEAKVRAFNRVEVASAADYAEGIARFEAAFPRRERKDAGAPAAPAGARPPVRSHLGLLEIAQLGPTSPKTAAVSMKAVRLHAYGPPDVLRAEEVARPEPGPGQVRVAVRASAVNPLDVKMRSGEVRHIYPSWFPDVLGYSVAGVIDAIGAGVTERRIGEEVYGINNPIARHGYAQYVVGPARFFYPKPARMDFPTAAAAPSIFATAYGGLFLRANLQAGQTVLIHGGAGVIGSCAVQLAHQANAHVIATASGHNVERVRALGADLVVDYKAQRFEDFARDVDLVFDTVGGETRERSWPLLRKGGTLASLLPPPPDPATAARHGVRAFMVHGHPDIGAIMPEMTRRLEAGELAFPEVAVTYPLEKAAEAHEAFERSAPRGRIVLTVGE